MGVVAATTVEAGEPPGSRTTNAARGPTSAAVLEGKILVGLGELTEAESRIAQVLADAPEDLTALNLFAKIKHMNGELSQAVACWAQLHVRSPHNERALMRLASLLALARDPERNAGDFVAFAPSQLAPILELEAAFRQLIARRPEEAKATCRRLASKYKGVDREIYKLCVLATAWIAELTGDLSCARQTLEDLGRERGFETDTDRVLGLARVYESLGDRPHLEKAVHVHRWLDRSFEKMSAQSRLAAVHRKLGNVVEAERVERRFQEAFEQRMHRPSRAEIARVAAVRFFPLERLASIKASSDVSSKHLDEAQPRERAIFDFLSGDVARARTYFENATALLDRKYLGSLRASVGDRDGAIDVMLGALLEDPHDVRVADFLLVDCADRRAAEGERIERALSSPLGERVREGLELALTREPRSARVWLALSGLLDAQGKKDEAVAHRERAQALQDAQRRDAKPIGRVLAAAVYHFVGKSKGLVHQIWADRKPASRGHGGFLHTEDILGNVTPDMRSDVRNTFLAVREYARSRFPHQTRDILDYDYTYKVTKEDEPSGGLSAGVPSALAFLSVFLQRPIPQDIAFSGVVIADSHDVLVVRSVGDAEYKVKAAYHRNLRAIVLPAENRDELSRSREVPHAIVHELAHFVANLDQAITLTFGARVWIE